MEQNKVFKTFFDCVKDYNLITKGVDGKILVACSGGSDSMTLLDCLYRIKDRFDTKIIPVHINHLLRQEATKEAEELAKEIKRRYGLTLFVISCDVKKNAALKKIGVEECGRNLRLYILGEVAHRIGATKIALGHNLNDQAETLLFRMTRGTGYRGLCGMKPISDKFIRPLLFVEKAEIEAYVKENGLFFIDDYSNYELCYDRNILRHKVLPQLVKINKRAVNHLVELSKKSWELETFLSRQVNNIIDANLIAQSRDFLVFRSKLLEKDQFLAKEALRAVYERFKGSIAGIDAAHIENFYLNALAKRFFKLQFPHDVVMIKSSDIIFVSKKSFNVPKYEFFAKNGINQLPFGLGKFELKALKGDVSALTIRGFREGDIYMGKKLKTLFYDAKIPQVLRQLVPLVALGNEVVFLPLCEKNETFFENSSLSFKINFLEGELYSKMIEREICNKSAS